MSTTLYNVTIEAPYNEVYWIICETILIILSLFVFFILFVVTHYICKLKAKSNNVTTRHLLVICLISTSLTLCRLVSDQFVAFWGWQNNTYCRVTTSVSVGLYTGSACAAYIFLWYRQYIFYSEKTLKHLLNKQVGFISKATLVVLATSGAVYAVIIQIPSITKWRYEATPSGCRDVNDEADVEISLILFIILTLITQTSLLGLLLYPLISTKKRQERTRTPSQTPLPTPQATPTLSRKSITPRKDQDLVRVAMMGAKMKKLSNATPMNPLSRHNRHDSFDSAHGIYRVSEAGFSSDDESNRSGSEANLMSDVGNFTSQSEFDSDVDNQPSTSRRGSSTRNKKYIKRDGREGSSRPGTPSRSRRGSNGSVSSAILRRIRRTSLKVQRSKSEVRKERKLKVLIRKVFFLSCICVLSDVIFTLIQLALVVPELVYLVLYDVNLFINVLCIILSFKEWKKILIAPIEENGLLFQILCKKERKPSAGNPLHRITNSISGEQSNSDNPS